MNRSRSLKLGLVLSYVLLAINTLYGLFVTPFILRQIGQASYGVYTSVASLSASLAVLDLGLGATTTRYMAIYNAQGNKKDAGNFLAMIFVPFAILATVLGGLGGGAYFVAPTLYSQTFTADQIGLSQQLILVLVINMVLRLFENLLAGVVRGFEHFALSNGVKLASLIIKIVLIFVILPITKNILFVVLSETVIVVLGIVFFLWYTIKHLGVVPKLTHWDKAVFKESFAYTALMFVQTLTIQFNGNVDNILIGAQVGATSVAVYSMALLVFSMYENLSGSVANMMLPNMARRVVAGDSPEQLQRSVEKAGRLQFMLLAAALGGFCVLGQDFYALWLGRAYADCYYLTLILIIPVTLPMVQNVCLSVLRAQNRMGYRTITLAISCVINIVISLLGIYFWGYWGAAVGTAAATISNVIFMNIYYHRVLKFRVFKMFYNIFKHTVLCAVAASLVTFILHHFFHGSWLSFLVNVAVYCGTYGICLFVTLDKAQKDRLLQKVRRKPVCASES